MLNLYFNCTPNRSRYYFFDQNSKFKYYLDNNFAHIAINLDNARMVNNVVFLKKTTLNQYDYTSLTYLIEERDGFWRCYFVGNCQYYGNQEYRYTLIPDLWSNEIAKAQFKRIYLKRSNKQPLSVQCGKYHELENVTTYSKESSNSNDYVNYNLLKTETPALSDVYVVFSVVYISHKRNQALSNTVSTSNSELYAVKLSQVINTDILPPNPSHLFYLIKAIRIVGGIYAIMSNNDTELEAYVSGMYLLSSDMLPDMATTTATFKTAFESDVTGGILNSDSGLKFVNNSFVTLPFDIPVNVNSVAYFGTKSAMLKLPRVFNHNGKIEARIEVIAQKTDVQVIARCGDDQLDISSAFALDVPNSSGATDPLTKIARGVSTIGAITGAMGQAVKGDYVGGAVNGFKAGLSVMQDNAPNAQYKNNGDGMTTWLKLFFSGLVLEYPIVYTYYLSANASSENLKAKRIGASFNQYIDSLNELFTGRNIVDNIEDYTVYVQASVEVDDITIESANYIQSKFNEGIELYQIPLLPPDTL